MYHGSTLRVLQATRRKHVRNPFLENQDSKERAAKTKIQIYGCALHTATLTSRPVRTLRIKSSENSANGKQRENKRSQRCDLSAATLPPTAESTHAHDNSVDLR